MGEAEVPTQPQRIVALELPYIDMLASLRVSPVGLVDDGDPENLIPEVRSRIGEWESVGSRSEPNLEQIAKLEPDLIIADNDRHAAIYDELSAIAPTVVFTARYAGYEKTLDVARQVGDAINKTEEMNAEIGRLEGRLDELSRADSEGDGSHSLAVIPRERGTAQVLGEGSYVADILDRVRVPYAPEAAAYPADADSASTGLEGLAEIDPAVLFVMTDAETTMKPWESSEVWRKLTAVENGDVHAVSRALWTRSRGLVSMELIAEEAVELFDGR
ncbi:iron complex transport system substrate-binding protein [Prauserella isguenensis]|uniref:Iron complex transport system substrate-binding protein n=1 Tax=Prauserella isguenensis TaxID=1470180 RepID=A0A839S6G3_9PSEU|nr:ABC transporter substrate-binding protein [Prauserella isguenensis]MBB3053288.1 iron complex transport system substrate-binding protein [Prauserella isguenensis]